MATILGIGVSGLTNSSNISDLTKRDTFWLYLSQYDEKVGQKNSLGDFCSVWHQLTR